MAMLTWEEVLKNFENLVKYAAGTTYREKSRVDNAVGADDLYQVGMITLYKCFNKYAHLPLEEFKAIFSTALFRAVRRGAKNGLTLDLEEALVGEEGHEDDYIDKLQFKEGLEQLKSSLQSPIALAILQELIEPSPRTIWEVWADGARKRQLKHNQDKNVNLSKHAEVKMKHIKNALQITQKQFDLGIKEIRNVASLAFVL
jgi:hypothetical protein